MKKRRIVVPIILLALACPVIPGFDSGLKVRCYTVESDAVQAPVRVALISDLHSCGYGENQRELIDAVDSQNPDLFLMMAIFSTMSFPTIIRNNSCAALGNGIHATM